MKIIRSGVDDSTFNSSLSLISLRQLPQLHFHAAARGTPKVSTKLDNAEIIIMSGAIEVLYIYDEHNYVLLLLPHTF